MADKQEIIRRLLNVKSYTAEELGASGFTLNGDRSTRPVILVGLDTVADIIDYLCEGIQHDEQNQRLIEDLEAQANIERQVQKINDEMHKISDDLKNSVLSMPEPLKEDWKR